VGFLVCGLAACGGTSDDESSAEGAVQAHTLVQAQKLVKDFYGDSGPHLRGQNFPELTAEFNAKLQAWWHSLPPESDFTDDPISGSAAFDGDRVITVGKPNYVFGEKEAVLTVQLSTVFHGGEPSQRDELATVRVRMSDLKISDISLTRECGPGFELVGQYDIRTTYPNASGGAGRVEVYWSRDTLENCVIARCVERCDEKMRRSVSLRAEGGEWVTDKGEFSLYAGPVKVRAPSTCIDVRASFGPEGDMGEATLNDKHCN
jgi:hypothetical protein